MVIGPSGTLWLHLLRDRTLSTGRAATAGFRRGHVPTWLGVHHPN